MSSCKSNNVFTYLLPQILFRLLSLFIQPEVGAFNPTLLVVFLERNVVWLSDYYKQKHRDKRTHLDKWNEKEMLDHHVLRLTPSKMETLMPGRLKTIEGRRVWEAVSQQNNSHGQYEVHKTAKHPTSKVVKAVFFESQFCLNDRRRVCWPFRISRTRPTVPDSDPNTQTFLQFSSSHPFQTSTNKFHDFVCPIHPFEIPVIIVRCYA